MKLLPANVCGVSGNWGSTRRRRVQHLVNYDGYSYLTTQKVNRNGGAIAFGHPLGCTGARQVATLFNEMERTGEKIGITSMCVGTGMGMAAVFVKE